MAVYPAAVKMFSRLDSSGKSRECGGLWSDAHQLERWEHSEAKVESSVPDRTPSHHQTDAADLSADIRFWVVHHHHHHHHQHQHHCEGPSSRSDSAHELRAPDARPREAPGEQESDVRGAIRAVPRWRWWWWYSHM